MGSEYDTGKIRMLAQAVARVSEQVAEVNTGTLRPIEQEIPENFAGESANALSKSLEELRADIGTLSSGLSEISAALYALARRLDAADAAARSLINQK